MGVPGDEIKKRMNILNFLEASRGTSSSVDTRPTSADGLFSNSPEAERRRVRTLLELLTAEFESDRKMDMYMILLRMIREENRKAQSASPTGGTIEEPDEVNEEDEEYEEMYEEDDMNEEDEEMTEVDPCHTPTSLPSSDPAEPELPTTERAFNPVRTYSQKKWDDEKSGKLLCNTDERNIIHGQKRRGPSSM